MELLIVYFVLSGTVSAGLFGRYLGIKGVGKVTAGCVFLAVCCALNSFVEVGLNGTKVWLSLFNWIDCGSFAVDFGIWIDGVTVIMLNVVLIISLIVHIYSLEYMASDPHIIRFMTYLSLFTFFMLMLIVSGNMVQMFLGWEGVGLSSYLLINFWFTRMEANKSALKAIFVNRVGDFGIGFALVITYSMLKTLNFGTIFSLASEIKEMEILFLGTSVNVITLIGLFLLLGAVGKSAQLGLHVWLPDAMEGPTPVSALIHAATMVTAGVYVLVRFSPLIDYSLTVKTGILLVGGLTAYFAGTVGIFQNDVKKIIAYSTCSQLGYMVYACGISNYSVALFHLFNHAFFKALLFLGAGAIIHALNEEQDIRRMGGLLKVLPFVYVIMLVGSLSLMGFPFMTGFYSKDVILELSFMGLSIEGRFMYYLLIIATMCTALYSFRLISLVFYLEPKGLRRVYGNIHEVGMKMIYCLSFLAMCSIFVGYIFKDIFVGLGSSFFNNAIFVNTENAVLDIAGVEFIPAFYKSLPVLLSLVSACLGIIMYDIGAKKYYFAVSDGVFRKVYIFLNKKWLFDYIYNKYINTTLLKFGYEVTFKMLDRGLIEFIGPTGLVRLIRKFMGKLIRLQSGYLYHYAYIFLIGVVLYILSLILGFESYVYEGLFIVILYLYIVKEEKNG